MVPLEEMVSVPFRTPVAVGVKLTDKIHGEPLSGRGDGQVVGNTWKSPEVDAVMPVTPVNPKYAVFEATSMPRDAGGLPTITVPKLGMEVGALILGVARVK
jgi:hypothetical protein